ncbi:MAG: TonB-dependent receptor, partial [Pseudomonadota bacterium]
MNRAHYGVFSTALLSSISLFALNAATAQDASGGQDVIIADPVVISATRYETPIQEVGSAISVLDAEELSRRQFLRLEDALQLIPGVTVDLNGSPGRPSPVRLRGLGPRNTLVLVDGMEVADTSRSQVQFEFGNIPPETVERVEVLRGPQSALYGADSAGGVINIITRKPEEPFEAQARVEYGSFNTFKPFLEAGGRHESGFYALGSFSYTDIDGFSSFNEDRGGSEDDPYISRAWLGKAGKDFDNGASIELRGRYVDETTASDRNNADLIGVYIDKEEFYYGGTASLPLLDGRLVNQVTASYVEHERFFDGGFLNGDVYEGSKAKVDYLATFDFYEAHTTAFGIEWEEERLDQVAPQAGGVAFGTPADAAFLDEKVATVAAFAQHQWRPIEGLSLIAGIRADDNEKFGTDVTARGSIAYDIQATGTRLRASGGSGIVTPSLYELNDVCIGNADLDPEESVGFDVGVDQTALGGRADVSLTLFRTEVEDQIAYVSSPTDGTPLTPACAAFFGT